MPEQNVPDDTEQNTTVSTNQPHPGVLIEQNTPTKAYRQPFVDGVEFDTSEATWDALLLLYPEAWTTYYNETAPSYSEENAVRLGEAIRFWQYMNVGETVTYQKDANENTYGSGENGAETYAPEGATSGTYTHPDGFYDPDAYARTVGRDNDGNVVSGAEGQLPTLGLGGSRVIGTDYHSLFSPEYSSLTEYETTHRPPTTPYEWGGPYAVGKYKISNDA